MPEFERFDSFVDLSTAHITKRDMKLLLESSGPRGNDSPILAWGNHEGFGCFAYIPEERLETCPYDEHRWAFSEAFLDLVKQLQDDGVRYVRFDQGAKVDKRLPRVWGDHDG